MYPKRKIIRHKWIIQDGFHSDKCEHCGCIRKWDDSFKRMVYFTGDGSGPFFFTPYCKRVFLCDYITKT
jgi:hypothetical protein